MPVTKGTTDYRAMARARAASLVRSGVDVTSSSAIKAARGTQAQVTANRAARDSGGISQQSLGRVLATHGQEPALMTMSQRYGGGYTQAMRNQTAQAGLPILAAAKLAAPIVKSGIGFAAGMLVDDAMSGVTAQNGGSGMTGDRYGGWTDIGVEGPGVFSPKDITPTYYGGVTKQWVANGTPFQRNEDGTISVQKKDGTVKTYRPYKPIVFGKQLNAKKLVRVANKHRSIYKELHKIFGTRTRTVKK